VGQFEPTGDSQHATLVELILRDAGQGREKVSVNDNVTFGSTLLAIGA
jgi:hypothetical protein